MKHSDLSLAAQQDNVKLTHKQLIRVKGLRLNAVTITTLAGYAEDTKQTVAELVALDAKFERATQWAWSYQAPSVLEDNYAGKAAKLAAEREAYFHAPVLENNQTVSIEGHLYRVLVLGDFSDPVHFRRL